MPGIIVFAWAERCEGELLMRRIEFGSHIFAIGTSINSIPTVVGQEDSVQSVQAVLRPLVIDLQSLVAQSRRDTVGAKQRAK